MITIRRTAGGYLVRIRRDVPPVFIGDNYIGDRHGIAAYLDRVWWLLT